jgi:DNA-binding LacI/PurR family transcriptional regulator
VLYDIPADACGIPALYFIGERDMGIILAAIDTAPSFYRDIIRGAADVARSHGLVLRIVAPSTLAAALADPQVIGAVCSLLPRGFRRPRKPVVGISVLAGAQDVPCVPSDDFAVGRLAAEHLLDRGFRSLAALGAPAKWAYPRCKGFVDAVRRAGLTCPCLPSLELPDEDWTPAACRGSLIEFLRPQPKPFGLFYAASDPTALVACAAAGFRVPEDAALVVGDDVYMTAFFHRQTGMTPRQFRSR